MSSNFHDVSETSKPDTMLPRSPLGIIVWGDQGGPKRNEGEQRTDNGAGLESSSRDDLKSCASRQ